MTNKIQLSIVGFILIIGIITIFNTLHELKHYYDLKDEEIIELCAFRVPLSIDDLKGENGFAYAYLEHKGGESSEVGATIISFVFGIGLFLICLNYVYKNYEQEVK